MATIRQRKPGVWEVRVFTGRDTRAGRSDEPSPARIGARWNRARRALGIDLKWLLHDLRHWTATAAISRGHDVGTVAARLGHADPAMTMPVYAHVVEGADQAVALTLGQAIDGDLPPATWPAPRPTLGAHW
jgi:integrase